MFKKPFTIGQSHKVSGADRKKLRRSLEKAYGVSEADLEALLPAKAGELECAKLASPSRVVLYMHDGAPLLLDPNGKGDLVPTVFALWRLPGLLPQVPARAAGCGLPPFEKEQLVAVCSPGNPAPLAVGRAVLSSAGATERITCSGAAGPRGKMVEVLQHYGDCLWADVGGRAVPNDGYLVDGVVPPGVASIEALLAQGGGNADGAWDDGSSGDEAEEVILKPGPTAGANAADGAAASSGMQALKLGGGEGSAAAAATDDGAEAGGQGREQAAAPAGPAPADDSGGASTSGAGAGAGGAVDMDALLESVLLQALHKSVKDTDLPLNSSVLWNQHMLPLRPAGSTLDVKRSKHKKMSKFLQAGASYGKAGLLTCKEDRHSGDVIVTGINRKAALYAEFRPYKTSSTEAGAAAASASAPSGAVAPSGAAAAAGSSSSAATASSSSAELYIDELYKPGKELRPVFEELGLNPEGLYAAADAAEAAFAYVKHANLEANAPDNKTIVLDPTLCDALFKGLIKKGELYPTHLAKAELREALMRRMHPQTRISRGAQQVIRKGQPPAVQISTEKRQGNKKVTKISGLEPFLVDLEQLVLQGSFAEPVADFIMNTFGIPKKFFQVKKQ
ncbi:hypothetical protein GPECTOR_39g435 [Gonium pectorale]|uniref:SUI1 domain-containing protein n=1 Tax=Gonium pectorale TaxID=33097 RepID=A0A150GAR4_GONPE|nr:hypothetical protein GPECTOR_39g435 [Gonium pectorale]|eukprot:KXZ46941.1 hypothetical protein GPECTOR_39g435 [Gonium pectorale]